MNETIIHRLPLMGDREQWPSGPWDDEPDRVQWTDDDTGLACLIRRGPLGNWCGYVGVPEGHPWHGMDYHHCVVCRTSYLDGCEHNEPLSSVVIVHGGLTFAAGCDGDPVAGVCHVADDGDTVWWLGFDCGHGFDLVPGLVARGLALGYSIEDATFGSATYRDIEYVRGEVRSLAQQVAAAAAGRP